MPLCVAYLFLASNTFRTASSFAAIAANPYTVSVGNATTFSCASNCSLMIARCFKSREYVGDIVMSIVFAGGVNVNDVGERGRTCVCIGCFVLCECVLAPGWGKEGGRVMVMNDE